MRTPHQVPLAFLALALAAGAAAQDPPVQTSAPFELVGPPAVDTSPWDQSRAIAWSKEQREAEARAARREAGLLCATSAVDLGLTEAVLAREGGVEHNALVRNRGIRIGLSAGACLLAQVEARGKHPKPGQLAKAKWIRLAAAVANVVVLAR